MRTSSISSTSINRNLISSAMFIPHFSEIAAIFFLLQPAERNWAQNDEPKRLALAACPMQQVRRVSDNVPQSNQNAPGFREFFQTLPDASPGHSRETKQGHPMFSTHSPILSQE